MLGNIGPGMLILLVIAALLVFGPRRLPELGRAIGRTLNEFKKGAKEVMADEEEADVQKSEAKSEGNNGNDRRLPE